MGVLTGAVLGAGLLIGPPTGAGEPPMDCPSGRLLKVAMDDRSETAPSRGVGGAEPEGAAGYGLVYLLTVQCGDRRFAAQFPQARAPRLEDLRAGEALPFRIEGERIFLVMREGKEFEGRVTPVKDRVRGKALPK